MLRAVFGTLLFLCAASASSPGDAQAPVAALAVQRAELWNSEQFVIHSKILDRDMLIQVVKPLLPPQGKVAGVYLLDGNHYTSFALNPMMGALTNEYAQAFFIGVGYAEQSPLKWYRQRAVDLVHAPNVDMDNPMLKGVKSGGGAAFQRFLVEEVRPAVESRYPIDPARTILSGVSLGGLFATRVLLDAPDAFGGYLIGSPSLWAEPGLVARARSVRLRAGTRIFVATGATEDADQRQSARALASALRRNTSGVTITERTVADEAHIGFAPAFFSMALRDALPPAASAK